MLIFCDPLGLPLPLFEPGSLQVPVLLLCMFRCVLLALEAPNLFFLGLPTILSHCMKVMGLNEVVGHSVEVDAEGTVLVDKEGA